MEYSFNRFGDLRIIPTSPEEDIVYLFCEVEIGRDIQLGFDILRWVRESLADDGDAYNGQDFQVKTKRGQIFLEGLFGVYVANEFERLSATYLDAVRNKEGLQREFPRNNALSLSIHKRVLGAMVYAGDFNSIIIADFINDFLATGKPISELYGFFCGHDGIFSDGVFTVECSNQEIMVSCSDNSWRGKELIVSSGRFKRSEVLDFFGTAIKQPI